jgi:hypothetical protein
MPATLDREAWKALGIGLGLAVVVSVVPLLAYIVDFLRIIIHESGHTLAAWLFGYPAIPVLRPGGAVSALLSRQPLLVLVVLALLGRLVYRAYRTKRHRTAITIGVSFYLLLTMTELKFVVIAAMGHGAELMVASLFLYRALSGRSIQTRAERPLYATLAFVIYALDVRIALQLLLGSEPGTESFDGPPHDLLRIADEYLHVELRSVVLAFLVSCLMAPVAVFGYHWLAGSEVVRTWLSRNCPAGSDERGW